MVDLDQDFPAAMRNGERFQVADVSGLVGANQFHVVRRLLERFRVAGLPVQHDHPLLFSLPILRVDGRPQFVQVGRYFVNGGVYG